MMAHRAETVSERLMTRVTDSNTCYVWQFSQSQTGCAVVNTDEVRRRQHRLAVQG